MPLPSTITTSVSFLLLLATPTSACLRAIVCWMPKEDAPQKRLIVSEITFNGENVCGTPMMKEDNTIRPGHALPLNIVTYSETPKKLWIQTTLTCKIGWQGDAGIGSGTAPGMADEVYDQHAYLRIFKNWGASPQDEEQQYMPMRIPPSIGARKVEGMDMICGKVMRWNENVEDRSCTNVESESLGFLDAYTMYYDPANYPEANFDRTPI